MAIAEMTIATTIRTNEVRGLSIIARVEVQIARRLGSRENSPSGRVCGAPVALFQACRTIP